MTTVSTSDSRPVHYDERHPPFLLITLPPVEISDLDFRRNLRRMDEHAARGGQFGFVLDTRGAPDPKADRRREIAEYWDDCQRRHGDDFVGAAIVLASPTARAVFKAILWLRQTRQPLIAAATPEEGLAFLRALAPTAGAAG